MMTDYQTYTEVGFLIHNTRFAIKIPSIRLRRPRFWRKKQRITSTSMTSSNSSSSFSYDSSDDWIRDFHARYNPLNTSTPIRDLRRQTSSGVMNCSGVKIYEDYDDLDNVEPPRNDYYKLVTVGDNRVIARLMFGDKDQENTLNIWLFLFGYFFMKR